MSTEEEISSGDVGIEENEDKGGPRQERFLVVGRLATSQRGVSKAKRPQLDFLPHFAIGQVDSATDGGRFPNQNS